MPTLIITEKSSQARDLRAALGDRFGEILPAEGHLLRLAEPHEVKPHWKSWSCELLQPEDLYPTAVAQGGSRTAKFSAIAAALKRCDTVILATDCDREGQLIGQEILEHVKYRGEVHRALFTAQDPKSIRQAFAKLKPNVEMRPLYHAAVARQQADQIFNLSLTRTATKTLLAQGTKGVIGIGRVKTPTLAIVCMREIEIRDFNKQSYFEVVATATVKSNATDVAEVGSFVMRHAPPVKTRITDKGVAEAIAKAAARHSGPLGVVVEERRQAPPRLYDLPSLQKTCGQRWGWGADKTLAIAQALYDGEGKKLLTYPRAEARHLAENQIADVQAIVGALCRLRGFAHLRIDPPVIRRGKSGHFCDKALEGVSHHAIVPNVNVMDDLEQRLTRLSDDEKRLFALVCRSYLAAVMPDFEYRQTVVTMRVPLPPAEPPLPGLAISAEFRATGRIPLKPGWKAAFGTVEVEADGGKKPDAEADQALPPLANGQIATLSRPRVQSKETQPPPRYSEGTLVDAMQNAWRFVADDTLRERLKEAKGIGTPATRAEIIKGLRGQHMITADGKFLVPTPAGLQVYELLLGAAPALVDPGTTAVWEMRLDDVVMGKADFRRVIDEIAGEAKRAIMALRGHRGAQVDLSKPPPPVARRRGPATSENGRPKRAPKARAPRGRAPPEPGDAQRPPRSYAARRGVEGQSATRAASTPSKPPTEKMIAFAKRIAAEKKSKLPPGFDTDFEVCRRFLDQAAGR